MNLATAFADLASWRKDAVTRYRLVSSNQSWLASRAVTLRQFDASGRAPPGQSDTFDMGSFAAIFRDALAGAIRASTEADSGGIAPL